MIKDKRRKSHKNTTHTDTFIEQNQEEEKIRNFKVGNEQMLN